MPGRSPNWRKNNITIDGKTIIDQEDEMEEKLRLTVIYTKKRQGAVFL
jgi:hypothetical protein